MQTRKRVDAIKAYYAHLILYGIASIALLSLKARILDYFVSKGLTDPGAHRWIAWNNLFIPIVWV